MRAKTGLDMCGNEIANVVAENLPTTPAAPKEGQFYYSTASKSLKFWNGEKWVTADASQIFTFGKAAEGVLQILVSVDGGEPTVHNVTIIDTSQFDSAGAAAQALASSKTYTDNQISLLMGGTPSAALDTLFELAAAIEDNKDLISSLQAIAASGVHKSKVYCPELTPSSGVCTWVCDHGLTMENSDIICKVYTASGEEVVCDVTINSTANVIIRFASDEVIPSSSYYAVFMG